MNAGEEEIDIGFGMQPARSRRSLSKAGIAFHAACGRLMKGFE